ncbi:hypothetical protein PFISCL1PPCAC_2217, partial [Pristionchus fissidentatus]
MHPHITLVIARDPNYLLNTSMADALRKRTNERLSDIKKHTVKLVVDGQNSLCGPHHKLKSGE